MVTTPALTSQQTAERAAKAMLDDDAASAGLGITLIEVAPGSARMSMTIRDDMVNGHQIAHGGLIATLADTAFAVACNSHGPVVVASGFAIDFHEPARLGDELMAEAVEVVRRGRNGIYDVAVTRGDTVIATFRGRSRLIGTKPSAGDV